MGRGSGRDSWAHDWFDPADQCRYIGADGVRCDSKRAKRHANGRADHLKSVHKIDNTTPVPTATGMKDIREAFAAQCPALSKSEKLHVMLARHGLPNRLCDDPLFRELTDVQFSRNNVTGAMLELSDRLFPAVLRWMRRPTLAIDVGTVHNRYLAFVLVQRGRAVFYKMIDDKDERAQGHFTIPAVRCMVKDVIAELKAKKCEVTGIVADNASNMQGIATNDDDELRRSLPCVFRCACHVLQLVVKDITDIWQQAFTTASALLTAAELPVGVTETRWNSKFRVIERAVDHELGDVNDVREMQDAVSVLMPIAIATDDLQRDGACTFDAVVAFEALLRHYANLRHACGLSVQGRAKKEVLTQVIGAITVRAQMLFNKGYMVLAYFSPICDKHSESAKAALPLVKAFLSEQYEIPEEEWHRYNSLLIDATTEPITKVAYLKHVGLLKPFCPTISSAVSNILETSPSEAAVERLFSRLKYSFDQWRNRSSPALVNASLQVASYYDFFFQYKDEDDRGRSQSKKHRASVSSPDPKTPQHVVDESDVEEEDDDDDDEGAAGGFTITGTALHMFQAILSRAGELAPPGAPPSAASRKTRHQADRCMFPNCNKPCKEHAWKQFVVCAREGCQSRRSIEHWPHLQVNNDANKAKWENYTDSDTHEEVVWTCPPCLNASS